MEVFFDEFKVTHTKSPVIQTDDYYPFGLTFNSYQRENSTTNQYLYNGKEKQDELGLEWLDYGARMYMPELGRWGVVDPLSPQYFRFSPYCYVANNPTILTDPDGKRLVYSQLSRDERKEFKAMFKQLENSGAVGKAISQFLKSSESGKIVLTANSDGYLSSFASNERSTVAPIIDDETGNTIKEGGITRAHPEIKEYFRNSKKIGGVLNVDLKTMKDIGIPSFDAFVEEAAHAALFSKEARKNGSNLDVPLLGGNDEFTAKAIVGQIEKESGSPITDFSKDASARQYGVNAFMNREAGNYYQSLQNWQTQQTGVYKSRANDGRVPIFFIQLINRN
ncbi:MAG: RHS repeat-associated core domain-containing protein [Cyclobacteriaceae bacterium]|nr:RHS repeat-associated core domain-containing protein [Cyclobacteriaceae bacterium]